eukprot:m.125471 g.125471  ORF g.125471 m.125471 type:complete len:283 (+) comp14498_c0_seq1:233-1081(+)
MARAVLLLLFMFLNNASFTSGNADTKLFMGVISAPSRAWQRASIRATWALRLPENVRMRFFVGTSKLDDSLKKENHTHKDIVLLDVEDTYANLSTKVPLAMSWTAGQFKFDYFVKIDDDVFLNLKQLLNVLKNTPRHRLYLGGTWSGNRPIRVRRSKHFLPKSIYPLSEFPAYNEGACYVVSYDLVNYIRKNLNMLRPVGSLEDITISFWMLSLQVHPQHNSKFVSHNDITRGGEEVDKDRRNERCHYEIITMPDVTGEEMRAMDAFLRGGRYFCDVLQGLA